MSQNTNTVWEDVIFENRNKEYGAYSIRMHYSDNVLRGTLFVGLLVTMFIASTQFRSAVKKVVATTANKDVRTIFQPIPLVIPDVVPQPQPRRVRTAVAKNSFLVSTQPVEEKPEEQIVTVSGPANGEIVDGPVEEQFGPSNGVAVGAEVVVPVGNTVFDRVEIMPTFDGGMSAMSRYLQRKLRYPSSAQRQNIEGTVYVSFVVNGAGEVTDVQVIKGMYHDCDVEAARVIASMPKWKAGKQHNRFVSVRMVLPIKFALAH
jgi:protein TonB